jgi:hypothetical protein
MSESSARGVLITYQGPASRESSRVRLDQHNLDRTAHVEFFTAALRFDLSLSVIPSQGSRKSRPPAGSWPRSAHRRVRRKEGTSHWRCRAAFRLRGHSESCPEVERDSPVCNRLLARVRSARKRMRRSQAPQSPACGGDSRRVRIKRLSRSSRGTKCWDRPVAMRATRRRVTSSR